MLCCGHAVGKAEDLSGRLGLGLGNPYLCIKYGFNSKLSGELRAAFGEGIAVYGVRGYYNFNSQDKSVFFVGGELDTVNFEKKYLSGYGEVLMLFVGLEHFISKSLSFCFDIGPAYISLHSGEMDSDGIEWVYNLGINFYF